MVYLGRTVIIGQTGENPFIGFILASKSHKHRRMETRICGDKTKVYVLPKRGFENDNIEYPEVDNYACISAQNIIRLKGILEIPVMIGFNGHMCKRCMANIEDGMKPEIAIDSTLFEFRGAPADARIGGIIYVNGSKQLGILGINDSDKMEKRIKTYPLEKNQGIYTCIKNTDLDNFFNLPKIYNPEELAKYFCRNLISNLEYVISAGACILRDGKFYAGVYNSKGL
jgi:IMP cyclohydrolase